jgi:hypothetical protein
MSRSLTVEEKYSRHWPAIAAVSGIAAILLFSTYLFVDNGVLIDGYIRLASFVCFALMVLSLFKVKDGKVIITIECDGDLVLMEYSVRNRIVYEEEFRFSDFEELTIDQTPNRSLYNDFAKYDRCVRFKKPKSEGWLYLNELYGRTIPLTQANAERIKAFLESCKSEV